METTSSWRRQMRFSHILFGALAIFTYVAVTSCSDAPKTPNLAPLFIAQYKTGPQSGKAAVSFISEYSTYARVNHLLINGVSLTGTNATITSNGVMVTGIAGGVTFTFQCPTPPATVTASASDGSTGTGNIVEGMPNDKIYLMAGVIPSGTYSGQRASIAFLMRGGQPMIPSINIGGILATGVTANLGSAPGTVDIQGLFGSSGTIGATASGVGSPTGAASVFGQAGSFTLPSTPVWNYTGG